MPVGHWMAGPTPPGDAAGWTYGVLANHVWSFADAGGPNNRPEVDQTFIQPFIAYTWTDSTRSR